MQGLQEAQGNFFGRFFWMPLLAPRPLPQSWSSHWHPTIARYNGVSPKVGRQPLLPPRYHTTMAPCNGTTSTPAKLVVTLPPNHSALQWHPTTPAMAPHPLHPAMAPCCHVQSAKVVRRRPPVVEVRTPIAIAIWGKIAAPCSRNYFLIPVASGYIYESGGSRL